MTNPAINLLDEELDQLRHILKTLVAQFDQLLPIMNQEEEAIKGRDPDRIEQLARDIAKHLKEIRDTDQLRQRLTIQLGKRLGLQPDGLNIEKLDLALAGKSGLMALRIQLKESIHRSEEANRKNQAVFKGVLAATESMLRALKEGTQGPSSSYNRRGYRRSGSRFHLLSKQL